MSAQCHWATVAQQQAAYEVSSIDILADPWTRRFSGHTENVARLTLDCAVLMPGDSVAVRLDGDTLALASASELLSLKRVNGHWQAAAPLGPQEKNPRRYGPFKEAFNHRVLFVFGTQGLPEENDWALAKARFDAERWWTQGNGSVDIIADTDFDPAAYPDRSVILYGNAISNAAWSALLKESPVQVKKDEVKIGRKSMKGKGLACLFCYPRPDSDVALVGVVGGTDLQGMRLTDNRPYLYAGYALPDVTVFNMEGDKAAGFFGTDWSVAHGDFAGLE